MPQVNDRYVDSLDFPAYPFQIEERAGKLFVLDPVRRKWVPLLPEEWVRQHVMQFLIREKGFPAGLLAVEKGFQFQGMPRRADVIAYDRNGEPALMVECKAPDVPIDQAVFDQIARYNRVIRARYLFVTNGVRHYCSKIDWEARTHRFIDTVPAFRDL